MCALAKDLEIELKLQVEPAQLDRLAELLIANVKAFSAPRLRKLESHYFDTADRRLRARGVSLRVRRTGDNFVQTVKTRSEDGGAHSVRGEWECPVDGLVPRLDAVTDPLALDRMGLVLAEELEHVFATEVERQLVLVEQPVPDKSPSMIEVAFDRGYVVVEDVARAQEGEAVRKAAERKEGIAEVELELKAGSPRGIYLLLEEMRPWAPLRIAIADKAERGYRLADGGAPAAVRATRPALESEMTVSEAVGAILRNCVGQWLRNISAARDGRDIEGVHQLRVAARRCRSALSLFTEVVGRDTRAAWNDRLKSVIGATGRARALDVFLTETLPKVARDQTGENADALAALGRRAEEERCAAYAKVRTFLDGRDHADLVLDLATWVGLERWQEEGPGDARRGLASPVVDLARRLLEQRHKRVRKLGRHFGRLSDAERHEVRLALKKLRYGVEFLAGLFPGKAAKRYTKAAAALQDVLGQLNDQAETHALLCDLARSVPARPIAGRLDVQRGIGFMLGWQAESLTAQRAAAEQAWETFMEQPLFWHASGHKP